MLLGHTEYSQEESWKTGTIYREVRQGSLIRSRDLRGMREVAMAYL